MDNLHPASHGNLLTLVGLPIPAARHPVVLITLPDNADLPGHLASFIDAEQHATEHYRPYTSDPTTRMHVMLTYPELHNVRSARWVYIAWRGLIRCRHRSCGVYDLQLSDLAAMDAPRATRMHLGRPYMWVDAEWEGTALWPAPQPAQAMRYGLLSASLEYQGEYGEQPLWL